MLEALDDILRALDDGQPLKASPALGPLTPVVTELARRPWPLPRESILALRRLVEAEGVVAWPATTTSAEALAAVLSSGPELPRFLIRRPRRLELLLDPQLGEPRPRHRLERELDHQLGTVEDGDDASFAERIAGFRNDQFIRLAACEFLFPTLEQVGMELSLLADVCLHRTMEFVVGSLSRTHGAPLCGDETVGLTALAMGKYGAQELNFCSDIDVVFIYASDDGQAGELTLHELFSRACRRITRILSDPNPEGYVFRVDLRLRPEGSRGPICNSLAGAERYYETWGGPYDRLAWLKARPAAGDLALGEEMMQILRPFVFPRALRPEVVEQIQQLYQRINTELEAASKLGGWNVKLGDGGIRQVEFLVQALQLLHAGKQVTLQERATLRALDKLMFHGLITEREQRQLAEAYELWRRLEHRLQLCEGRQTHLLPDDPARRRWMAGHLGVGLEAFETELVERRGQVRAIYATLSSAAGGDALTAPQSGPSDVAGLLDGELPRQEAVDLLERTGFAQAKRAAEQLEVLSQKPWGPFGHAADSATRRLGLALLEELVRSPDPDAALRHTVELVLRYGPFLGFWELLDQNRATLRLLVSLFGSSDHLARLFIEHPELMDQLLGVGRARREQSLAEMREELLRWLSEDDADDLEARLNTVRRFRNEEVLRVGLCDIAGDLTLEQVWAQLSDLAQACVESIYPMVRGEACRRYGTPRHADGTPATMTILGLGKLGSRELTYASDLDLIFIFSDGGETDGRRPVDNGEFFARLAQRLIGALSVTLEEGRLYEVDTRLRPSGNQGTLVVSRRSFEAYHRQSAELWERQALIKARFVAGDLELGSEVEAWIGRFVYQSPPDPVKLAQQMDHHRVRMEKELADENGGFYNLKFGPGGLLDVDFIAQYCQLRHGGQHRSLRQRSTLQTLARLEEEGLIASSTVAALTGGYRFLRRIESRLRIVRDRSAERLPRNPEGLEVMARRLGYRKQPDVTPGSRLLAEYQETTESIRAIYHGIFKQRR